MKPGDMLRVKDSSYVDPKKPVILVEKYHDGYNLCLVVLDPGSGQRYHFQEHNVEVLQ